MLFNSIPFLVFFILVVGLFYLLPTRYRLHWVLLASYFFYGWWNAPYLLLLIGSSLFNYQWALWLHKRHSFRELLLMIGIIVNLSVLIYFKYYNFFTELAGSSHPYSVVLPLGISFITLQAISYLVDVYRKDQTPVPLLPFALYKAFFPQLLAGPIERAGHLIHQFAFEQKASLRNISEGGKLMLWGYFKKALIADKLALLVDPVYDQPYNFNSLLLGVATFLFSFQIYCDFSGYTDVARGAAQILGVNLSINFSQPYRSKSIMAFWQRWHRTLHTWFKDYVYRPLKGSHSGAIRWVNTILLIFLLSGLWHGANLTFIVWGLYHAVVYLLWVFASRLPLKLPGFIQVIVTFTAVVVGWIFFRAESLADANYILNQLFHLPVRKLALLGHQSLLEIYQHTILGTTSLWIIGGLFATFLIVENSGLLTYYLHSENYNPWPVSRLVVLDVMLVLLILFGDWAGSSFIYYQF